MTTRSTGRPIAIAVAALFALLIVAPIAEAKENVEVALAAPISSDAQPGDDRPGVLHREDDHRHRRDAVAGHRGLLPSLRRSTAR